MSTSLPDESNVPDGDDEQDESPRKSKHPMGSHQSPFNIFAPDQRASFLEAVGQMLSSQKAVLPDQEQRTIRLEVDGSYEYVQAVVERLRQVFNVTWVSAQSGPESGGDVVWLVVVEWPEFLPKSNSSKPLTKAQWYALEWLYKQRSVNQPPPIPSAIHRSTLQSLLNRWPAFARLCPDGTEHGQVEITEAGVTYYEIHQHVYLERHWNLNTTPPQDGSHAD